MARSYGRLFATIWDDEDFRPVSRSAKCMYFFLISQADLEHSGVIGLRVRRWSRDLGEDTPDQVVADIKELDAGRYVVVDEDAEELLVRTLIRRDEVWKQPNVLKSAMTSGLAAKSKPIKAALYEEMTRLNMSDASGESRRVHEEFLVALAPFANPSRTLSEGFGNHPGAPVGAPVDAPERTPVTPAGPVNGARTAPQADSGKTAGQNPCGTLPEPSAKGGPEGQGEGIGSNHRIAFPLKPSPDHLAPGSAPLAPPADAGPASDDGQSDTTQTILAAYCDWCEVKPPKQVRGQLARLIKGLLDEGIPVDAVKNGLAEWTTRDVHPSVLPSVVNNLMNGHGRQSTGGPPVTRRHEAIAAQQQQSRAWAEELEAQMAGHQEGGGTG